MNLRIAITILLTTFLANAPLLAQTTNQPSPHKKSSSTKQQAGECEDKPSRYPYHGKLKDVNKAARTFQVGNTVYHLLPESRISKAGKPATLADAAIGEQVSGLAQKGEGDKRIALSLTIGPKPDTGSATKKKKMAE